MFPIGFVLTVLCIGLCVVGLSLNLTFEYNYIGVDLLEYSVSLVTFNLHNEVFGELGQPPGLGDATDPYLCLTVIDNSLTLLHIVGEELEYHVWQRKDYGKEESWAILFKITFLSVGFPDQALCDTIDGKSLIVTCSRSLIVYDEEIASSTCLWTGRRLVMPAWYFWIGFVDGHGRAWEMSRSSLNKGMPSNGILSWMLLVLFAF